MIRPLVFSLFLLMMGCTLGPNSWGAAAWFPANGWLYVTKDVSRFNHFEQWVRYYQKHMGIEEKLIVTTKKTNGASDYCAFVTPDIANPSTIYVVLVTGDPLCDTYTVEHYALHELCHVRLKHLYPPQSSMTTAEKHYEVNQCMADYRRRRKEWK